MRSMVLGLVAASALVQCTDDPYAALVRAHAPVHFQDTDDSCATCDELTAIDYDGDWDTTNNWENLFSPGSWGPTATGTGAVVYRSVVETCTHWYVVYAMYHPRDWDDGTFDQEHENDLEGALVVVEKDGTPTGTAVAMVTVFHNDFYSYLPAGSSWTGGAEDVDGTLSFTMLADGPHPTTSQEAKGHGIKAWPFAGDFAGNAGEDGITYVPGDVMGDPPTGDDRDVPYVLVDLFDVVWWSQLAWTPMFASFGLLEGDEGGSCGDGITLTCSEDAASLPWRWDDGDDGASLQRGMLALDPATLVDTYFDDVGEFSRSYVSNRYAEDLRASGYTSASPPAGWPGPFSLDELYTRLGAVCSPRVVPDDLPDLVLQ